MPNTAESYRLLRESAAIVRPEPTTMIQLWGADAIEWLQGQATNDLRLLRDHGSISFCLCKATGQIEAVCNARRMGECLYVSTSASSAAAVLARVETMVILEDVQAGLMDEFALTTIQGPLADEAMQRCLSLPEGDCTFVSNRPILALRHDRCGFGGWDLWAFEGTVDLFLDLPEADTDAFEAVRIEAGLPAWGKDIGPKTLPAEMGAAFEAKHVSYSKGCYVGQEVLMRMHSRGRANWDWMGLVAESPLEVGAKVSTADRPDAGTVTSVAVSPRLGPIGTARVRREIALEGQVVTLLQSSGEIRATLRSFPMD